MHFVKEYIEGNVIYIAFKGRIHRSETDEIVDRYKQKISFLKKELNIIFDFREFRRGSEVDELKFFIKVIQSVINIHDITIIKIGPFIKFLVLNKAVALLEAKTKVEMISAKSVEKVLDRLKEKNKSQSLIQWFINYDFNPFVDLGNSELSLQSGTDIRGINISGKYIEKCPITVTVNAENSNTDKLYYRFVYYKYSDEYGYNADNFELMSDKEYVLDSKCTFSFLNSGRYLIDIQIVSGLSGSDFDDVCSAKLSICIKAEKQKRKGNEQNFIQKIFAPNNSVEIVIDKDLKNPVIIPASIYKFDSVLCQMILFTDYPKSSFDRNFCDIFVTAICKISSNKTARIGVMSDKISLRQPGNLPDKLRSGTCVTLHYKILIQKVDLRKERKAYRVTIDSNYDFNGIISFAGNKYISEKYFSVLDISASGIGVFCPKCVENSANPVINIQFKEKVHIEITMADYRSEREAVTFTGNGIIVRKTNVESKNGVILGILLLQLDDENELILVRFLNDAQLNSRNQIVQGDDDF